MNSLGSWLTVRIVLASWTLLAEGWDIHVYSTSTHYNHPLTAFLLGSSVLSPNNPLLSVHTLSTHTRSVTISLTKALPDWS